MKKTLLFLLVVIMLFSVAACGSPSATPTPAVPTATPNAPAPTPTAVPATPTPTAAPVGFINPLTGLETETDISGVRPVAVMINDLRAALPQCGVSKADMIYEVLAEGGITRMLVVFQSVTGAGSLGSIRSTRSYYLDIAQGLDAILLHCGASVQGYADIASRGYRTLDAMYMGGVNNLYYRDADRINTAGTEHSLFTDSERLDRLLPFYLSDMSHRDGYKTPLVFGASSALAGTAANKLTVEFSFGYLHYKTGVFNYNADDARYYIEQFDAPYIDGNTGEQVSVKNVLVLRAQHTAVQGDELNTIEVGLIGSGTGIYLCEGKSVEINWSKANYDQPFVYTLKDGRPLVLAPGNSYINIVNTDSSVTIG